MAWEKKSMCNYMKKLIFKQYNRFSGLLFRGKGENWHRRD
jgi:hypothetical protein